MIGKASEIKTYWIEEIEKSSEWEIFQVVCSNAVVLDIKYSSVYDPSRECIWNTALIIYKEGEST